MCQYTGSRPFSTYPLGESVRRVSTLATGIVLGCAQGLASDGDAHKEAGCEREGGRM
jgi:hypothetical protein